MILTGDAQDKLWDEIVAPELKAAMEAQGVPESAWDNTRAKLDGFKAAFGTILFFEDQAVVKNLQEQFALYADNFPVWSEQGSGIISVNVWTAVAKEWNLPESWKLRGQLVFGSIEAPAGEKTFMDDADRFIVAK